MSPVPVIKAKVWIISDVKAKEMIRRESQSNGINGNTLREFFGHLRPSLNVLSVQEEVKTKTL